MPFLGDQVLLTSLVFFLPCLKHLKRLLVPRILTACRPFSAAVDSTLF